MPTTWADRQTEREILSLTRRIRAVYTQAVTDLRLTCDDYFTELERRKGLLIEELANGTLTLPKGETEETYFVKWLRNQTGRGSRWEAVREEATRKLVHADEMARDIVNKTTPSIAALNHDWTAYTIEEGLKNVPLSSGMNIGAAFNLMDAGTAQYLSQETGIRLAKDYAWNDKQLQAAFQSGVISGESIPNIAKRLESVADMDKTAAIRTARTACAQAQNAGKQAAMEEAEDMGIEMQKEWISTTDERTRESHVQLNGVRVDVDEPFPNGLMHPGDADGDPAEVFNCRCTMRTVIKGFPNATAHVTGNTAGSYNKWRAEKEAEYVGDAE